MEEADHVPEELPGASQSVDDQQEEISRPIPFLPFEILSSIFLQILPALDKPNTKHIRAEACRAIIHASQVCQDWRSVALQLPAIWQAIIDIDSSSVKWIRELLRRSRNLPLTIRSIGKMDNSTVFRNSGYRAAKWEVLFNEMHRIRVFHLMLHRRSGNSVTPLVKALLRPAPLMESVLLMSDGQEFGGVADKVLTAWPTHLFGGIAPRLREVVVRGMGLARHLRIPNVKLESLYFSAIPCERIPSPLAWLDILVAQPHLSMLCIHNNHSSCQLGLPARYPQVVLPHLKYLDINARQDFINELLPRIVSPRRNAYVLHLASHCPRLDQFDGILQALACHFENMAKSLENGLPCRVWTISWLPNSCLTMQAFFSSLSDRNSVLSICLYLPKDQAGATIIAIFELLRSTGLLREAQLLRLHFSTPLSEDTTPAFVSLLHSCRNVSHLVLMGAATVHMVLNSISWDLNNNSISSADPSSAILLPKLDLFVYSETKDEFRQIQATFFAFLTWRYDIGRKVHRVWISSLEPEHVLHAIKLHNMIEGLGVSFKVAKSLVSSVVGRHGSSVPFPSIL